MRNKIMFAFIMVAVSSAVIMAQPVIVWDETWDSGLFDMPGGIALDAANDAVYLAGTSRDGSDVTTDDIVTLKYDTDGSLQWDKTFDSDTSDDAYDVTVDGSSYIYVAGYSSGTSHRLIRLIKYDADGVEMWNVLHDSPREEAANAVTTDESGNIYVTGTSWGEARTVKFASNGDEIWASVIEGFSGYPNDLAVAPNGSIYVVGSGSETTNDPLIIRMNSDGDTTWYKYYDMGTEEVFNAVAIDGDGYLYLTGYQKNDLDSAGNILIAKCDADGNLIWDETFDYGQDDAGLCIALDQNKVFVSGSSYNTESYVMNTPLLCFDKDGNVVWDTLLVNGASGRGIASDGNGNLYISLKRSAGDFGLIKVNYATGAQERPYKRTRASLEVLNTVGSNVAIHYSLPAGQSGTLTFYTADGRKVESYTLDATQSSITWDEDEIPAGVYFAELTSGSESVTVKAVLIK